MPLLEVKVIKPGSSEPDQRIVLPLNVVRANPVLLPKFAADAIRAQGIAVEDLVKIEGVNGPVLEVTLKDMHLVVSILQGGTPATTPTTGGKPVPANVTEPPGESKPDKAAVKPKKEKEPAQKAAKKPLPKPEPEPKPKSKPEPKPKPKSKPEPKPKPKSKPEPEPEPRAEADSPLTTEFIATELGWRTGHDLIFAACAHFTLAKKIPNYELEAIDEAIKQVSQFYKPFYSTNLLEYMKYLMKAGKLYQPSAGEYALTPPTVKYLQERLSEEKLKKRI
ncbi:MAG: hypothetical protein BMS9Abin15_0282 [Gammaproteobacteria bacterium]|nr:MAG: hypothetical protein BMS9Abin15_0282 [Gammaproteobacteria bacterium]